MSKNNNMTALTILNQYKPNFGLDDPNKIANFLMWAAKAAPNHYWLHNMVLKAIRGFDHMPRVNNPDIEVIRRYTSTVKRILFKNEFAYEAKKDVGIRALYDANLKVEVDIRAKSRRATGAYENLQKAQSIVDPTKLNATNLKYFNAVSNFQKSIASKIAYLLPEKASDDSDGSGKPKP